MNAYRKERRKKCAVKQKQIDPLGIVVNVRAAFVNQHYIYIFITFQ